MPEDVRPTRVLAPGDVAAIAVAGGHFLPIRHTLGVRAFGINAYTAQSAGDQVIETHDETGAGSGRHEELYLVLSGAATFRVGDDEIVAPTGAFVFVPDTAAKRSAVATADDTTVLVIGGPATRPLPVSPFEYWYLAEAPYAAGDYQRAIEICSEGLVEWPDHPQIHYQLACYNALAGDVDQAVAHLIRACADPRARTWATTDPDLAGIRDDPRLARA